MRTGRALISASCGALAAATVLAGSGHAADFDAERYFSGKTIRVVVGFSAGGGTDLQARLFAQYWTEALPGHPRFTVTNVRPSIASANRLYRSDPDGTTIEMTAGANVTDRFTSDQVQFRVERNRVIGSHAGSSSVLFARKELPYKSLKDAMGGKVAIRISEGNATSGIAMRLAAMSQFLGIPIKFVPGARGTADELVALERGDVDAFTPGGGGNVWYSIPYIRPGWLKNGTIRPFAQMGPSTIKIAPNSEMVMPAEVPYVSDLLKDPKQREEYEAFADIDARYSKIWMAPPETPDTILGALRQSYKALLDRPDFRTKLEQMMGEPVTYTPGDKIEKDLGQMVQSYEKYQAVYAEWSQWAKDRY
jgi:tripartite-type tricarboxylate transporter receptor subunit TctC